MDNPSFLNSIHHSGSTRYVFPNQPHLGEMVTIRLRAALGAPIKQILLRTSPDGEGHLTSMHPENLDQTGVCRWWRASIYITMPLTSYRFLIISDETADWYNGSGLHAFNPQMQKISASWQSTKLRFG
jgi:alpha-glucosidase